MKIPVEISLLPEGKHRIVCPSCGGGGDREPTLSVTIQGSSVQFNCFRASCTFRKGGGNVNYVKTKQTKLAQDKDIPGYVRFPIYDNEMSLQGWEHRAISKSTKPKSKLNTNSEWCNLCFVSRIPNDYVLLVEDRLSAIAMNPWFPCVALMGVHLNKDKVKYLTQIGVKCVIIALDADATAQAIRIKRNESIVNSVYILKRDLKDTPTHELLQIANELYKRVKK